MLSNLARVMTLPGFEPKSIYFWSHLALPCINKTLTLAACRLLQVAQMVKNLPARQETRVQSLGWEDPLEEEMATHSSSLAWRIPWTEEPGVLQSMGSQRVGHDWLTNTRTHARTHTHTHTHAYRGNHRHHHAKQQAAKRQLPTS